MALEDIFRALEEQADKDVEEVLAEARAHAEAIRAEAEAEARDSRTRYVEHAEASARMRGMQSMNAARLEARKKLAGVKEKAVARAFEDALAALGSVRSRPEYGATFRALLDEALQGVDADFEVLVDPADEALAREVLKERGITSPVRAEISTAGGVVIALDGGRVLKRNTLEDRLEKYRGLSQAEVAGVLFS